MSQESKNARRGAVAVIESNDRLLVIRRSQFVVAPGCFCFPGGGIEGQESECQALVREVQEELNAAARPIARLWQNVSRSGVELAWWQAEFLPGQTPRANPAEVESIHWHTLAEIAALDGLLESNHDFLRAVAQGQIVLRSHANRGWRREHGL